MGLLGKIFGGTAKVNIRSRFELLREAISGTMSSFYMARDRTTKERAVEERNAVVNRAFERGLLVLGAGKNAIRFSPPLVLTREQADVAVRIFDQALSDVERNH